MAAGAIGRTRYRIAQGCRALLSPLLPLDIAAREDALAILPVPAVTAFRALPRADQRHAMRVYHTLIADGEAEADVLAAALLHDIGKHPGVGITQRSARVLLAHWPCVLSRVVAFPIFPRRWRGGLGRLLDHAALGADRAAAWGCTDATVAIIRASHDLDAPAAVRRLQAVDDRA